MDYLPKDPAILVSSVRSSSARLLPTGRKNMLLRDEEFDSLESLCYAFIYLAVINVVTFFVYGIDKAASKRGQSQTRLSYAEREQARPKVKWKAKQSKWRVSEATLLGLAVIGGSIGAWLGMKTWHHKTLHQKFRYGVPAIIIAQLLITVYILYQ